MLAWFVFFLVAGWVFPPLDSHLRPALPIDWSFFIMAVVLALATLIIVPAYVYQSWRRLPTVPNRIAYALWVGVESVLLLALPICLTLLVLHKLL